MRRAQLAECLHRSFLIQAVPANSAGPIVKVRYRVSFPILRIVKVLDLTIFMMNESAGWEHSNPENYEPPIHP
jgi:hypothetical protein